SKGGERTGDLRAEGARVAGSGREAIVLALVARALLALVLFASAIGKLRRRVRARDATVALLGPRLGRLIAIVLPFVELALAVLLCAWWSVIPGMLALLLLLGFTVVVVRAQTRHLPCACFGGGLSDAVPGSAALVRNAVLVALAVLATGSP